MIGKHLIADIFNISNNDLIKTIEGLEPLMKKIIEEMKRKKIFFEYIETNPTKEEQFEWIKNKFDKKILK